MDRLQSMRVFERVVSEGGFAAAARALDLSAPVVTRLVADLESHLGTRLLQRSTRNVSLTEAGKSYLSRVRGILQDIDEADESVRSENEDMAGRLRVHVSLQLVHHLIGPSLVEFRQRYPRIRLDIEISAQMNPAVEEFDASLMVVDQSFNAAVVARKLAEGDIVLVASPDYLRRRGEPNAPEDLSQHDCLRLKEPMGSMRTWRVWRAGAAAYMVDVPVQPALESNQGDLLLTAALGGAGITSSSLVMVAQHLAAGELVRVLPDWTAGRFTVYAALPSRKFIPRRTQVFLDFLVQESSRLLASARQSIDIPDVA